MTLGLVVFRWLSCLFFTSDSLGKGLCWRCLFLSCVALIAQFQRRRALIFGDPAGIWVPCFGLEVDCLVVSVGFWSLRCQSLQTQVHRWERGGHGLTSRPLEASDPGFLDDPLSLVTHLGLVSLLLMVLPGCGIPPIFPIRSLQGSCSLLVVWLPWLLWLGFPVGSWFAGVWGCSYERRL